MKKLIIPVFLLLAITSCKNKDINEGEAFRPRELNEDFDNFHFNKIVYDGVEYLITERDNNNPHEGFGFMAFRANGLIYTQDSILAHLKVQAKMQSLIYSRLTNLSIEDSDSVYNQLLSEEYLQIQNRRVLSERRNLEDSLSNLPE